MPPRKHFSDDLKQRIIKLLKEGNTQRKVAEMLNCSHSAISYINKKFNEIGSVVNRTRCGRPRSTSKRDDRQLRQIVQNLRRGTSKEINGNWAQNVCDRTVRNRLNEMGYSFCKAKTKPFLTKLHRKKRLEWCKEHRHWTVDDWKKVIFSDESRVCIGAGDNVGQFVWRKTSEKFNED